MQFLLLVYFDENHLDSLPPGDQDEVWRESAQFRDDLARSGRRVTAKALRPTAEAAAPRVREGRTTAVAGPFTEAPEPLGGFVLVEAATGRRRCGSRRRCPPPGSAPSRCGRYRGD